MKLQKQRTKKQVEQMIKDKQVMDLHGSEIACLCRSKTDFTGAVIIQTRGSHRTTRKSEQRILDTGCTDFIILNDQDR